jgi:3'-5' exoribonuclease
MAKTYVADLQRGGKLESTFAAKTKQLLPFRNKPGNYLTVVLGDKTGEVQARAWDNAEALAELFEPGQVVRVRGRVEEYQGALQVIIERLRKCADDEIDPAEYVATTQGNVQEMLGAVHDAIAHMQDPHLRALLEAFFADPDFVRRFTEAPGAKALHHRYLGGLLEHVVSLLCIGAAVCDVHATLDRDLLVAGIILHDVGKLQELDYGVAIDYTDQGRLIGHVVLGDRMIQDRIRGMPGFPAELAATLSHIVLSHHGSREWGAPIEPMMPEAIALHYIDNIDAKIWQFTDIARQAASAGKTWSDWQRLLERYVYAGRLTGPPVGEAAAQAPGDGSPDGVGGDD